MKHVVWFYWHQGWEQAPWFVKQNFLSWRLHNTAWKVVFLHKGNMEDYSGASRMVAPNAHRISVTALSDVLRLDLLANRGGVWVDATVLCRTPLDDWLPQAAAPSGFFAFRSRCADRDLASWYMAAEAGNYLVRQWLRMAEWYWGEHVFDNPNSWEPILTALEQKYCVDWEATDGFLSEETLNVLRVYPYFWVNYLHQRLVRVDPVAAEIWNRTPDIFCGPQSTFLQNDPLLPLGDYTGYIAAKPDVLMLKFDRRRMPDIPPEGSALEALYQPLADMETSVTPDTRGP